MQIKKVTFVYPPRTPCTFHVDQDRDARTILVNYLHDIIDVVQHRTRVRRIREVSKDIINAMLNNRAGNAWQHGGSVLPQDRYINEPITTYLHVQWWRRVDTLYVYATSWRGPASTVSNNTVDIRIGIPDVICEAMRDVCPERYWKLRELQTIRRRLSLERAGITIPKYMKPVEVKIITLDDGARVALICAEVERSGAKNFYRYFAAPFGLFMIDFGGYLKSPFIDLKALGLPSGVARKIAYGGITLTELEAEFVLLGLSSNIAKVEVTR